MQDMVFAVTSQFCGIMWRWLKQFLSWDNSFGQFQLFNDIRWVWQIDVSLHVQQEGAVEKKYKFCSIAMLVSTCEDHCLLAGAELQLAKLCYWYWIEPSHVRFMTFSLATLVFGCLQKLMSIFSWWQLRMQMKSHCYQTQVLMIFATLPVTLRRMKSLNSSMSM